MTTADAGLDPITLEVITQGMVSIVREMRATVVRTAHSTVVSEGKDFSCALFDAQGRMACQSEDQPAHVVPIAWSVRETMRALEGQIDEGDVILTNDSYRGGTHLNDVAMIYPSRVDGDLFIFPCIRLHWTDIGGMTPGSLSGAATDIYQEGIRIPPIKVIERGRENRAALDLLLANVRLPDEALGDFHAKIAACMTAERRIRALAAKYGRHTLQTAVEQNMDRTERRIRAGIERIPDGEYLYEDFAEYYGERGLDPVRIALRLTIRGSDVFADFDGSSPQMPGPVNQSLANTECGVFTIIKSIADRGGANNDGALRPIHVTAPPATIVNVQLPAPAGAASEARKRITAVMIGALAQAVPELVVGDGVGASNHNLVGGIDPRHGRPFIYYDFPAGGTGGFKGGDGASAIPTYDQGDVIMAVPVEPLEATYPLSIEQSELRTNSAGAGQWRGGFGLVRKTRLLVDGRYSLLSDRAVMPPFGIAGGECAGNNRFWIERAGEAIEFKTPGKVSGITIVENDVLTMEIAGGGGFGDPIERDAEAVRNDVLDEYVSREDAASIYGIILDDNGRVDEAATRDQRAAVLRARVRARVGPSDRPSYDGVKGSHRICLIHPDLAERLNVRTDDILVIRGASAAPLRGWVVLDPDVEGDVVPLDEFGMRVLAVRPGDTIWVAGVKAGIPIASSRTSQP